MEQEGVWLLLDYAEQLPRPMKRRLAATYPTEDALYRAARNGGRAWRELLGTAAELCSSQFKPQRLAAIRAELEKKRVKILTRESLTYPNGLYNIEDCPDILYYRGDPDVLLSDVVAVVGTRRCSSDGLRAAEWFSGQLTGAGVVVASGLAEGVDAAAHRGALKRGRSIGVAACGLDWKYPASNTQLYDEIVERGGLILTEHRPAVPVRKYLFPLRNRILAGISRAVLVAEAPERSGALITAERARDAGVPVFALPASVMNPQGRGGNRLIAEGSARMATGVQQILELLGKEAPEELPPGETPPEEEGAKADILAAIRRGINHLDGLAAELSMPPSTLTALLAELEIDGAVRRAAGNEYYI